MADSTKNANFYSKLWQKEAINGYQAKAKVAFKRLI